MRNLGGTQQLISYFSGYILLPVYFVLEIDNYWNTANIVAFLVVLDGICLVLIFFASGKSVFRFLTPHRQILYFGAFLLLATVFALVMASSSNYTETLTRPYMGISGLTGKTFDQGTVTSLGLSVILSQAIVAALAFSFPREIFNLILHSNCREV